MKNRIIILFLSLFLNAAGFCTESYRISGKVLDSITKEPLEGAAVYVKEDKRYVQTDGTGGFSFETQRRKVTISARLPGYKEAGDSFGVPYENIVLELELSSSFTMGEVHVKEKRRVEGTKQKIQIEQVNKATTHLFSDSIKIIQTLPGVITGNDFSSLMYVRGGEFYETACFLDNIYILQPYMWGGNQSIFNPAFVDRIDFYSGGFPAKYPQALSGVLDVKNIEGDYEKKKGYVDLNVTTLELFAQGPMQKDKSSFVYGFRRTYYDLLMNLAYGDKYKGIEFPYFYDSQAKFTWKLNGEDKISLNLIGSYEGMNFNSAATRDPDIDEKTFKFSYKNSRILPALNYDKVFNDELSMNSTLSLRYEDGTYEFSNEDANSTSRTREYDSYIKNRFTYIKGRHTIEQGVYLFRTTIDADVIHKYRVLMPDNTYFNNEKTYDYDLLSVTAGGTYVQDDIELAKEKLFFNIGGVYEYLDTTHDNTFCPRSGVKYMLSEKIALKFNTGLYTQFPANAANGPPPIFQNRSIKSEKAIHYVLGYEHELPADFFLRLETYIKDYYDRVVNDPDPGLDFTNNGKRKAQGIDLFFQKKTGERWDGWFAYSYLYARDFIEERSDPALFAGKSTLDYLSPVGQWFPFEKERTHNISVVFNYDFNKKYKLAATYRFSTGTPYTDILGVIAGVDPATGITTYVPVHGKYLDDRIPDYNRLDIKLTMPYRNWFGFGREVKNVEFYVQIINVFNTVNVNNYYYSADYKKRYTGQMLPFLPIVGFKYNF
ncbi:MAG: TonB-dependent receptor [Elusimicrobia bacterium]|nr:TonB-dependent receptor [Candidatus Liberimonas magnetica]